MGPEVRDKLKEVESLLHAATIWATSAHEKAMARMDRMDREHEKAMARMDKFERSLEKFDRSLDGVRKLLLIGAKEMVQMRAETRQMKAETRELKRSQKAFLDSLRHRNGGNGNDRKHRPTG